MRPAADFVGVLTFKVGVLARVEGVEALDVLAFPRGSFSIDGELERVDDGLDELTGLLIILTEIGSFEPDVWGFGDSGTLLTGLRVTGLGGFCIATSLNDRTRPPGLGADTGRGSLFWVFAVRYQLLGDDGSMSGSERLLW